MKYTDLVTARLKALLPKRRGIELRFDKDAVRYLHPTKGWKRISYKRLQVV